MMNKIKKFAAMWMNQYIKLAKMEAQMNMFRVI